MKIGDKVVMNDKYHVSEKNKGKVFTVTAGPQEVCGTMSVWLEGYRGCYAMDGLTVVEENTDLVKLKFLRDGEPSGREYTYVCKSEVTVGDTVIVREAEEGKEAPKGIITAVNVPYSEVESFKDKLKAIVGKVCANCETCEHLIACGEGDHICDAGENKVPIMDYSPADDYMWCGGKKYKEN